MRDIGHEWDNHLTGSGLLCGNTHTAATGVTRFVKGGSANIPVQQILKEVDLTSQWPPLKESPR